MVFKSKSLIIISLWTWFKKLSKKEINSLIGKETSNFLLFLSFFTQVTINFSLQAINNSRNEYFSLSKTDGSPR